MKDDDDDQPGDDRICEQCGELVPDDCHCSNRCDQCDEIACMCDGSETDDDE